MTSDDDGFPEAEDLHITHYVAPAVFDEGKVIQVTHGTSGGSGDDTGQRN